MYNFYVHVRSEVNLNNINYIASLIKNIKKRLNFFYTKV